MEELKQYINKIILDNPKIFDNKFYIDKYLTNSNTWQNVICININPFIEEININDIRKKCIIKFGYDIIPIDIDIYGCHGCCEETKNEINVLDKNILNKIIKFIKRHYNYFYLFYSNKTLGVFINNYSIKKIHNKAIYRFKSLLKKHNIGIDFIEYNKILLNK